MEKADKKGLIIVHTGKPTVITPIDLDSRTVGPNPKMVKLGTGDLAPRRSRDGIARQS
jgi:hypothetical protein